MRRLQQCSEPDKFILNHSKLTGPVGTTREGSHGGSNGMADDAGVIPAIEAAHDAGLQALINAESMSCGVGKFVRF